ncbi:hypothetical protein V8C86DRAFT_2521547 [Haematococcus lacustris]
MSHPPGGHRDGRDPSTSIFYRTRICNEWADGRCRFGDTCRYAHGESQLRALPSDIPEGLLERLRESGAHHGENSGGGPDGAAGAPGPGGPRGPGYERGIRERDETLRKTRLCKEWTAHNTCVYGDRCFYAHGQRELRPGPDPSRPGAGGPSPAPGAANMPGMMMGGGQMGMPGIMGGTGQVGLGSNPAAAAAMMMNPMAAQMMMAAGMGAGGGMMGSMGLPGMMAAGMGGQGMGMPGMMMGAGGRGVTDPRQGTAMRPDAQMDRRLVGQAPGGKPVLSNLLQPLPPEARPPSLPAPSAHQPPDAGLRPGSQGGPAVGFKRTRAGEAVPGASGPGGATDPSTQGGAKSQSEAAGVGPAGLHDLAVRLDMRYIDRVRATCSVLNIGELSKQGVSKPEQIQGALTAARNRMLYKANSYADDVASYLPVPQVQAVAPRTAQAAAT